MQRGKVSIAEHAADGRHGWCATVRGEGVTVDVLLFADAPQDPDAASLSITLRPKEKDRPTSVLSITAQGPKCVAATIADWTLLREGRRVGPTGADVGVLFMQAMGALHALVLRAPNLARFALLIASGVDRKRAQELVQAPMPEVARA